ncbi:atrial natriuretic peptide receptor 2-like [Paramacrobiotus metropolitanus]|uniref:atrial natriuretic peptide receptor 2-like n=1 Tax=Paramacrobiotus metropolitanus TaxID=2943436 RepID=UPI002445BC93|nr:atrial natriuretic peptide receptor 2-like [Paramacrobiotus metropolitanus]
MTSLEEILNPLTNFPDIQLQEETEITNVHYHGHMSYMGKQVWVKPLQTPDHHFHHFRQISKLLTSLSLMSSENVTAFIGMCYNHDKTCMLLLDDYCPRHSLHDNYAQLHSVSELKSSFVQDLLKGMKFIHESSRKSHGFLTSYSCLLSKNFTLKIAKLAYAQVKSLLNHKVTVLKFDLGNDQEIFWTAPEVLRGLSYPNQKCDMYSLGIILNEIFMAEPPYSDLFLTPKDVYQKAALSHYSETYRPRTESRMMDHSMKDLIEQCWHEVPEKRPNIQKLYRALGEIMDLKQSDSLVGRILNRLQVYATDLEIKVQLRTADLISEQKLCDALLQEMLPKSVVERLRAQEHVQPTNFSQTTIYFGDLLGFSDFASSATPFAVVTFLNTAYSHFDNMISTYDVYKVETIGDCYVVASGLPEPNGEKHITEIASMACRLVQEYENVTFRYNTRLRVGIHSGTVVAAVVGKAIPRYCLFGDTMNTASRMMSHGQAGKIHISPESAFLLKSNASFCLTPRGSTHIKGKGDIYTFWLDASKNSQRRSDCRSVTEILMFANISSCG